MGVPFETASSGDVRENPLGTNGMAFVEFSARDPAPLADLFGRLGFREVARHASRNIGLWRQGDIDFLLNAAEGTHGLRFAEQHGPCISAIAFRVQDAKRAAARALDRGAASYSGSRGAPAVPAAALEGVGGSLLYLVDPEDEEVIKSESFRSLSGSELPEVPGVGLTAVDHLTHNVRAGRLEEWVEFYRRVFNFRSVFYLDAKGKKTGFRTVAMKSPCNRICIPLNEPTDPESQIQEYIDQYDGEGVQHLAFLTPDLNRSIEGLRDAGLPMQSVPDSYYSAVDARLPGHRQDVARLRRNGILIDGERDPETGAWKLLLQIFSKNLIGPIFFEFIERAGNEGFGEGNAKALFEAIERDQIERGVVVVE